MSRMDGRPSTEMGARRSGARETSAAAARPGTSPSRSSTQGLWHGDRPKSSSMASCGQSVRSKIRLPAAPQCSEPMRRPSANGIHLQWKSLPTSSSMPILDVATRSPRLFHDADHRAEPTLLLLGREPPPPPPPPPRPRTTLAQRQIELAERRAREAAAAPAPSEAKPRRRERGARLEAMVASTTTGNAISWTLTSRSRTKKSWKKASQLKSMANAANALGFKEERLREEAPKWWTVPGVVSSAADSFDAHHRVRSHRAERLLERLANSHAHKERFEEALTRLSTTRWGPAPSQPTASPPPPLPPEKSQFVSRFRCWGCTRLAASLTPLRHALVRPARACARARTHTRTHHRPPVPARPRICCQCCANMTVGARCFLCRRPPQVCHPHGAGAAARVACGWNWRCWDR